MSHHCLFLAVSPSCNPFLMRKHFIMIGSYKLIIRWLSEKRIMWMCFAKKSGYTLAYIQYAASPVINIDFGCNWSCTAQTILHIIEIQVVYMLCIYLLLVALLISNSSPDSFWDICTGTYCILHFISAAVLFHGIEEYCFMAENCKKTGTLFYFASPNLFQFHYSNYCLIFA